ncbi:MAG: pyridoxine 5'-phosphate synthase [Ignavibacteriales bacterium]|nr:pyridoxine 5'-phosphate synthase [Ignavibacteriales bacterium]
MRLAINIDHIATLRNARGGHDPDPVEAALICEKAGAVGIVCHLREDRRHIKDRDVQLLRKKVESKLDLEMAATPEIIRIAVDVKPDLVTLVPEKRQELTTEGGLDVVGQKEYLKGVIDTFHSHRIQVSLFVDPTEPQLDASKDIGTDMIEIHTGEYAEAVSPRDKRTQLKRIKSVAKYGKFLGLGVNAGHGLGYSNIKPVAAIKEIDEVSIGHAIIVRAMFVGLERAVKEMIKLVKEKR